MTDTATKQLAIMLSSLVLLSPSFAAELRGPNLLFIIADDPSPMGSPFHHVK